MVCSKACFFGLLLCAIYVDATTDLNEFFVLKNPRSNLIIDLKDNWLVLSNTTGYYDTQLWKLVPDRKGLYYIVNKHEGKVLDFDSVVGIHNHGRLLVANRVRVDPNNGCPVYNVNSNGKITNLGYCQQWYVQNGGVIVNACTNHAVSILDGYVAGTYLKSSDFDDGNAQKFDFIYSNLY